VSTRYAETISGSNVAQVFSPASLTGWVINFSWASVCTVLYEVGLHNSWKTSIFGAALTREVWWPNINWRACNDQLFLSPPPLSTAQLIGCTGLAGHHIFYSFITSGIRYACVMQRFCWRSYCHWKTVKGNWRNSENGLLQQGLEENVAVRDHQNS
jgi:hypothetical protein